MTRTPPLPAIRLTMPAGLAHLSLVRACLRDTATFPSEDAESRLLLAVTEVMVNAIEASNGDRADQSDRAEIVVTIEGSPPEHVEIRDFGGAWTPSVSKPGHLGAGLVIAEALVPLAMTTSAEGTIVRLGIEATLR
ncbi:MAG: ATP-binding protein [Ilumatobacteraceae bacterium]